MGRPADVAEVREPKAAASGRLGELYLRHADSAVRLAYLMAEDLVQDAFVKLAGRLMHLRDPGAFDAYLRRTVVNLAHSHFRHKRVERSYLKRQAGSADLRTAARHEDLGVREELWRALQGLSARQRAAIVLRFYEDLSEAKTAEILGCPTGTVKSLVSRGLEALRGEIRHG